MVPFERLSLNVMVVETFVLSGVARSSAVDNRSVQRTVMIIIIIIVIGQMAEYKIVLVLF